MLSWAKYRMESGFAGAIMTLRLAPHARAEINLYWAARPPILAKATATVGRLGAASLGERPFSRAGTGCPKARQGPRSRPPHGRRQVTSGVTVRAQRGEPCADAPSRSEEHPSELQSLMRISYAVFCLKKNTQTPNKNDSNKR